ncbi:hypothetical protein Misp01_80790 [Microtetraspora sp. NBRC 13810]|uniref:SAM-dependent methyltransferase n=1 Tax=Microtetraspora sp. NBRC 13810 TaxID=3030990 RepID=UPI00249FECE9|nr:SAM-dependent methyltransferase [Microtetraspora sp. NBRC 13810]GLW12951.1 hypothetical protein Misp01_80790 [Microtetraspora sp. NBRC 13810]
MSEARRAFAAVNTSVPNIARINDYLLGGKDNFAADREAAEKLLAIAPEVRDIAREGQEFRRRVVRHLVGEGVTQFVTMGPGLPNRSNVHEIAQSLAPESRVVYVESDTIVLSHARALLATDPRTKVVEGGVMRPAELLADPAVRGLIDLDRPFAVMLLGVLQYIPDEDGPDKAVAHLRDALPEGGHLVISHVAFDARPELAQPIADLYRAILNRGGDATRTRPQIQQFFDGLEMVEPGLVYVRDWRPDVPPHERAEKTWMVGGVACKPAS